MNLAIHNVAHIVNRKWGMSFTSPVGNQGGRENKTLIGTVTVKTTNIRNYNF